MSSNNTPTAAGTGTRTGTRATLSTAQLDWQGDEPRSQHFDDIYFSSLDGWDESNAVFIHQNRLQQRWAALAPDSSFTIGETGFGTGLNFFCSAALWLEVAPADALLHYVSTEKHPLRKADLERVFLHWEKLHRNKSNRNNTATFPQQLKPLSAELLEVYPPPLPGFHRIELASGRIQLTLLFGDSAEQLDELQSTDHPLFIGVASPTIDAWFLDGFAPAKNPQMWSQYLFSSIAKLSKEGTTLSTFTASGQVRRDLITAGFNVDKIAGHGDKRAMLRGELSSTAETAPRPSANGNEGANGEVASQVKDNPYTPVKRNSAHAPPWYLRRRHQAITANKRAAIIGGGIAGCTTAHALAQRGWQVTLYDHQGIASGASGNPQGILYPKLSIENSAFARVNLAAMAFASRYYQRFWQEGNHKIQNCGVLLLPANTAEQQRFLQLGERYRDAPEFVRAVNHGEMENLAGLTLTAESGLFFPQLGWIQPTDVCQRLCTHPNIQVISQKVEQLHQDPATQLWSFTNADHDQYSVVVLANAIASQSYQQTEHLQLKTIRGQISLCPATMESQNLATVVCGEGYLAPAIDGLHSFGASYDLNRHDTVLRPEDHSENLSKITATDSLLSVSLSSELPPLESMTGRASLRCVSPDYLPLAGAAPNYSAFLEDFALLRENARAHIPRSGRYWPGLYLNCGHGSRGMSYAPLCAALIADAVDNMPPPLERTLITALNPARFIIRDLKRGRI
ncbi:MAG: FAD-dependent 5-carboxymethylaminomethyl-2-thiouridine(34) oxidoreductase MnmC [Porticoccaceae bacterium]